jgi:hypothetical protein
MMSTSHAGTDNSVPLIRCGADVGLELADPADDVRSRNSLDRGSVRVWSGAVDVDLNDRSVDVAHDVASPVPAGHLGALRELLQLGAAGGEWQVAVKPTVLPGSVLVVGLDTVVLRPLSRTPVRRSIRW